MRVAVYTRASTDESHQPYFLEAQSRAAAGLPNPPARPLGARPGADPGRSRRRLPRRQRAPGAPVTTVFDLYTRAAKARKRSRTGSTTAGRTSRSGRPTAATTCSAGSSSAPPAASATSATPPTVAAGATATTPASPATATAPTAATPNGCRPKNSMTPSSTPYWTTAHTSSPHRQRHRPRTHDPATSPRPRSARRGPRPCPPHIPGAVHPWRGHGCTLVGWVGPTGFEPVTSRV